MKRVILAVAVLLALVNLATANFLVIKVDLNQLLQSAANLTGDKDDPKGKGFPPGGAGGMKGGNPGSFQGVPGGAVGMPGMGGMGGGMMRGGMGMGGMPGGMRGGGMRGGAMRGMAGGMGGMPGGGMMGAGMRGMPGGAAGTPGGVAGIPGGIKGGFGGLPGGNAGTPGNNIGGPPGPPLGGAGGKGPKGEPGEEWDPLLIEVHIELSKLHDDHKRYNLSNAHLIDHPWGKNTIVPAHVSKLIKKDIPATEFQKRFKDAKAVREADKLKAAMKALAVWALQRGLTKEFHAVMAEIKGANDPVVAAYLKVKEEMTRAPAVDPSLTELLNDLKSARYTEVKSDQGHYSLFYQQDLKRPIPQADLKRRLDRLEATYEHFYYGLASQGLVLPLPKHRLVVVLETNIATFTSKHRTWGGSRPLDTEGLNGFTPRRDNVIVLSSKRNDDNYTLLERINAAFQQAKQSQLIATRDELLSGKIWDRLVKEKQDIPKVAPLVSQLQTLALIQKAMEDEAERAAITHEGTRQLLAASGLLPRSLQAPEWIQYGLSSFFETPHFAFHTSVGLPSWTNLVRFKYFREGDALGAPEDVLAKVVSNSYFRQVARLTAAKQERGDKLSDADKALLERAREELDVARATSWALVFYLVKNKKLELLDKYCKELAKLPRDLEFDEAALKGVFERSFEIRDRQSLKALADAWFSEMKNVNLEFPELERDLIRALPPAQTHLQAEPGVRLPSGGQTTPNPFNRKD